MAKKKQEIPKASHQGELNLNGYILPSAVLPDGTALFSERSLANAFGIKGGGAHWKRKKSDSAVLPEYLSAKYLSRFIPSDLVLKLNSAVDYIATSGTKARGIDATILSDICDVYVTAQKELSKAGKSFASLDAIAEKAYSFIKAFSKIGIIAMVYEVTGFEKIKEKDALQKFLEKFLNEDQAKWIKTYPDEFFEMIFKMKGLTWTTANKGKKPQWIGHFINNYVYSRMAPKILVELRKLNPKNEKGARKGKHTQWIDIDYGHPKLIEHLNLLIAFAAAAGYNEATWKRMVDKARPKYDQSDGSAAQEIPFKEI